MQRYRAVSYKAKSRETSFLSEASTRQVFRFLVVAKLYEERIAESLDIVVVGICEHNEVEV